jgi:large subunit ribosomal protein L15
MNLSNLQPAEGSTHNQNKRLGRGRRFWKGGTSARGHKGAKSRSGYSKRLVLKVVKCHFKDVYLSSVLQTSIEYEGVNLDTLNY